MEFMEGMRLPTEKASRDVSVVLLFNVLLLRCQVLRESIMILARFARGSVLGPSVLLRLVLRPVAMPDVSDKTLSYCCERDVPSRAAYLWLAVFLSPNEGSTFQLSWRL